MCAYSASGVSSSSSDSSSTASAAEVFVSDMKLMSKCEIYGDESTKGECLVQEIFELSDEGALLLSVGKIWTFLVVLVIFIICAIFLF